MHEDVRFEYGVSINHAFLLPDIQKRFLENRQKIRVRASGQAKSYSFLLVVDPSTATAHIFHTRHTPAAESHPRAKFDVLSEQQPPLLPHNVGPGQVLVDAKMNHLLDHGGRCVQVGAISHMKPHADAAIEIVSELYLAARAELG
jgi:hypothetical protein